MALSRGSGLCVECHNPVRAPAMFCEDLVFREDLVYCEDLVGLRHST